jgi:hypothetical protein
MEPMERRVFYPTFCRGGKRAQSDLHSSSRDQDQVYGVRKAAFAFNFGSGQVRISVVHGCIKLGEPGPDAIRGGRLPRAFRRRIKW